MELLKESPIEKISVVALCRCAEIDRSTFYAHYSDISSLLNEIKDDFIRNQMPFIYGIDSSLRESLTHFLASIKKDYESFFAIAKYTNMLDEAAAIVRNSCKKLYEQNFGPISKEFEPVLLCESDYIFYGYAYSVGRWFDEGCIVSEEYLVDSFIDKLKNTYDYVTKKQKEYIKK